ncbi:MAG TPA: hypothetical protein VGP07_10010 [Polyangia bacterium]|jgi:hypothetical protein
MAAGGLSLWALAALLGLRHALEPDHLTALSTLVAEERGARAAVSLGIAWGLGHTLALLGVATVLAASETTLPAPVATAFELAVGLMLIGLGLRAIGRAVGERWKKQAPPAEPHHHDSRGRWALARRSTAIGLVHGLAGSGALTALVASQLSSTGMRLAYVGLFGLCSTVAMAGMSGLAGLPLARLGQRPGLRTGIGLLTGAIAIIVGGGWVLREVTALRGG